MLYILHQFSWACITFGLLTFLMVLLGLFRAFCRRFVGPAWRANQKRKKFFRAYARYGGKTYVPQIQCAENNPTLPALLYGDWWGTETCLSTKEWWCGPDKFWEGPPAPKARDIEAWETRQELNSIARERAHKEVYGVPSPYFCQSS